MINFVDFVEQWAIKYKPMQHNPAETSDRKRFLTYEGRIEDMVQMLVENRTAESPIVVACTDQEGDINGAYDNPQYHLCFLCKTDNERIWTGREAQAEAKEHMLKFIAYMNQQKMDNEREMKGINVDGKISYYGIELFYDGWFGVNMDITNASSISRCVNPIDYVE